MTKAMVMVCIVMFVGILLLPWRAVALNRAQLGQLKATQKCQDRDLTGAELHGAQLSFANLFDANLTGANLAGAKLDRANLAGAELTEAQLTSAELFKATWTDGSKCKSGSIGKCIK